MMDKFTSPDLDLAALLVDMPTDHPVASTSTSTTRSAPSFHALAPDAYYHDPFSNIASTSSQSPYDRAHSWQDILNDDPFSSVSQPRDPSLDPDCDILPAPDSNSILGPSNRSPGSPSVAILDELDIDEVTKQPVTHTCSYKNCNRSFSRKSDLLRHMRIHTGDRPHTCDHPGCGKTFIQVRLIPLKLFYLCTHIQLAFSSSGPFPRPYRRTSAFL